MSKIVRLADTLTRPFSTVNLAKEFGITRNNLAPILMWSSANCLVKKVTEDTWVLVNPENEPIELLAIDLANAILKTAWSATPYK